MLSKVGLRSVPVMTYVIISMTYVIFIYLSTRITSNGEQCLILPCEVAVKSVIPAIKALMAKELSEQHGLKQDQVAEILGISQSAVSKYSRKIRGHVIKVDNVREIHPLIDGMIVLLMNREHQRTEFMQLFCETCIAIRKTSLMCVFCEKSDPKIQIQECRFCTNEASHREQG